MKALSGKAIDRAVPLVYLLLCALLLLPLTSGIGRVLPGPRVDTFQNIWNFWWIGHAGLAKGASPFWTPDLLFPYGADLSYQTLSLLNTMLAVPLHRMLSPVALLGIALFLAYPIGCWGGYLLARELTGSRAGAFVAGFFYAFFPHHVDQIYSHLNLTAQQFLPFFLLCLIRLYRRPTVRHAFLAALFLALQSYACWTYMVHGLMLLALSVAAAAALGEARAPWRLLLPRLGLLLLLFALFVTPLVYFPLRSSAEAGEFRYKAVRPGLATSIETFASPGILHPLFGGAVLRSDRAYETLPRGTTAYLGYAAIVLAALGVRRRSKETMLLAAGALFFALLSMGPSLQVRLQEETGVPLPYRLLQQLPVLRFLRVPNRFLVPVSLLALPLVAGGFARLVGGGRRPYAAALLGALLFIEYVPTPLSVATVRPPAFCGLLKERAAEGAVLDVPLFFGPIACMSMYFQTVHGRPIADAYISIPPPEMRRLAEEDPFFAWVVQVDRGAEPPAPPEGNPAEKLRALGFGDVVLHKDYGAATEFHSPPGMEWPEGSDAADWYWKYTTVTGNVPQRRMNLFREKLESWLGAPYYEDDRVALFAVPRSP